jgi:hypothetical protein
VYIAHQCLLQVFAAVEVMALQHVLDPAIEPFNHTIGLGSHWRGQAVFDVQIGAEAVELMRASGRPFAQAEQAVGELLAARPLSSDQWRTKLAP